MFEETPMRSTTQEILTHRHKCSQIYDDVGGKVMKLSSEKVQETPEKWMRGQRKTAVNMGREEDALTLLWLRLGLVAPQPPRSVGNQAPFSQILQIILRDRGPDPVALDRARRQAGPR